MNPASIIKLKRQRIDTSSACFFCQNNAGDLRTASAEGKARTRAVGEQRRQLGDTSHVYVLDRLNILSNEDFDGLELRWHKTCYSISSESKLQRSRKQCQISPSIASTSCPCTSSTPKRRSCQAAIDWSLCMFCQAHNNKKVHRVETLEKSADILERTATDPVMSIRLSGICDLIAAEGCYHLTCLITFERRCMKAKSSMVSLDNETNLCRELSAGLSRGHVYDMLDVWRKYESMGRGIGTTIPNKYLSRRTSFHEVVQQLIGSKASYIQQLSKAGSLLMYHGEQSDFLISRTLTK